MKIYKIDQGFLEPSFFKNPRNLVDSSPFYVAIFKDYEIYLLMAAKVISEDKIIQKIDNQKAFIFREEKDNPEILFKEYLKNLSESFDL